MGDGETVPLREKLAQHRLLGGPFMHIFRLDEAKLA